MLSATVAVSTCREPRPLPQLPTVNADAETPPVQANTGDDAADDPAIWVNPADPAKSVVIGTVKKYGLEVYDLQGRLLHTYKVGNPNNVDVRNGLRLGNGEKIGIVACSDRSVNELLFYKINPSDFSLSLISGGRFKSAIQSEIYGFCLYHNAQADIFYAFVNGKDGDVEQYQLEPFGDHEITGKLVRKLKLETQPEGMVADDQLGILYLGEEDRGIWKVTAEVDETAIPTLIPQTGSDNPNIKYDMEGLSIYYADNKTGYLLASSQGNHSYAVFERQGNNRYLGSFTISAGQIDGAGETDGLDVTSQNLSGPFSKGLLVVQDGYNLDEKGRSVAQNFKLVGWEKIEEVLKGFGK